MVRVIEPNAVVNPFLSLTAHFFEVMRTVFIIIVFVMFSLHNSFDDGIFIKLYGNVLLWNIVFSRRFTECKQTQNAEGYLYGVWKSLSCDFYIDEAETPARYSNGNNGQTPDCGVGSEFGGGLRRPCSRTAINRVITIGGHHVYDRRGPLVADAVNGRNACCPEDKCIVFVVTVIIDLGLVHHLSGTVYLPKETNQR